MGILEDLQATQKQALEKIAAPLAGVGGAVGTDMTAAAMAKALAAPYLDGRLSFGYADWQEADGTALAIFADGANPQAGLYLGGSEVCGLRWNDHANPDEVATTFMTPTDMDVTQAATISVLAYKVGATAGDAVTWGTRVFGLGDAVLEGSATVVAQTTTAMTGAATTLTTQLETVALAADSLVHNEINTFMIQPTDGTLGTDDVVMIACYIDYKKKVS